MSLEVLGSRPLWNKPCQPTIMPLQEHALPKCNKAKWKHLSQKWHPCQQMWLVESEGLLNTRSLGCGKGSTSWGTWQVPQDGNHLECRLDALWKLDASEQSAHCWVGGVHTFPGNSISCELREGRSASHTQLYEGPNWTILLDTSFFGHNFYAHKCAHVHMCAKLCKFMHTYAELCKVVQSYAELCKVMQSCAELCKVMQSCAIFLCGEDALGHLYL